MMRQHRGVVYADVECNMLHISVSYNTELGEDVQDLVCMQLPFIYTLKKGGLRRHICGVIICRAKPSSGKDEDEKTNEKLSSQNVCFIFPPSFYFIFVHRFTRFHSLHAHRIFKKVACYFRK